MQTTLLGLALALILAIGAALGAPAFVNWNEWRASFESRAAVLVGAPVKIHGNIDATILPTPAFRFRDVEIGSAEAGVHVRIGDVRGVLSLGALLRGTVVAEEFALVQPELRVTSLPPQVSTLQAVQTVVGGMGIATLDRVVIERGALIVERSGQEPAVFEDIHAEGEVRSRQGPMRIDGVFRRNGQRWGLRASTGNFGSDGSARARVTLDHAMARTSFDADGMLHLGGTGPRFEGKVTAAGKPVNGNGLAWQLAGATKASEGAVVLESLALSLGADAAPTEFTGKVEFEPRRGGSISGSLRAVRVDLDLAAGGETPGSAPEALGALRPLAGLLTALPLEGSISLGADAVAASGATLRDVETELALRDGNVAVTRLNASLPGRGSLSAKGRPADDAFFAGDARLVAEDAAAFARWAVGGKAAVLEDSGALQLAGQVEWRDGRLQIAGLDFALGAAKLGGNVAIEPGSRDKRARLEGALTADGIDLDVLKPLAIWFRGETSGFDVHLGFRGNALRVFERPLKRVDLALSRSVDGVAIERLTLDDFDGLSLQAKGRIAAPIERPSGTISFTLDAVRPDGLASAAKEFFGDESAALLLHVAGKDRPLKLSGNVTGAGSAAGIGLEASGRLGAMDATLAANFDLLTDTLSEAHVVLEGRDAAPLMALLGVSPGLPAAGSSLLEIDVSQPNNGALPLQARLSLPDSEMTAEGEIRFSDSRRIEPMLNVRVDAADLRPALAIAAQTGGDVPVPAVGSFRVERGANGYAVSGIDLAVGGGSVRGEFSVSALTQPALGGKLALDFLDASNALALTVGDAPSSARFWPVSKIAPAWLADATGGVDLRVDRLRFAGHLVATNASLRLRLRPGVVAFEEITGDFAGGKLSAHAGFVRGDKIAFDGRAKLEGADLAEVVPLVAGQSPLRGRADVTLTVAGSGATPAAIAGSLAGQGTIAVRALEIAAADPGAVGAVFAVEDDAEPRDEISILAALAPALAAASMKIEKLEAPIVVAAGSARSVKTRATAGAAQVALEASIDLARLTLDASVDIEAPAPEGLAVRPGATLRWKGPLDAPERGIEAAALANAITLRAMERETKRIEERDRALPPPVPPRDEPSAKPRAGTGDDPFAAFQDGSLQRTAPGAVPSAVPSAAPGAPPPPNPLPRAPARADAPRSSLPPLPPPTDIRPAPPVFRPDPN